MLAHNTIFGARAETIEQLIVDYHASGATEIRDRVVNKLQWFVRLQAEEYVTSLGRRAGVSVDEMVSAGNFRLLRAIDRFNTSRNEPFTAYARKHLRGAMRTERARLNPQTEAFTFGVADEDKECFDVKDAVTPDASDVAADRDTVAHLLSALAEPARTAVLLHYRDSMDVAAVSREIGSTPAAVARLIIDSLAELRANAALTPLQKAPAVRHTTQPEDSVYVATPGPLKEVAKLIASSHQHERESALKALLERLKNDPNLIEQVVATIARAALNEAIKDTERMRRLDAAAQPAATPTQAAAPAPEARAMRGLASIAAASRGLIKSWLDEFKVSDGRKLGDVTGGELEEFIGEARRNERSFKTQAAFYTLIKQRTPENTMVRWVLKDEELSQLWNVARANCTRV